MEEKMRLAAATIAISLALVFYTLGVFAEKKKGSLMGWHLILFWIGFLCDTLGTTIMTKIAENGNANAFHGITGLIAILLMLVHAIWASIVLAAGKEESKIKFHRFSIFVWIIWLIPYFSGMIFGTMNS